MNYICPVCGYNKLEDPPANHEICPCCGTQFGYHNTTKSYEDLRKNWVSNGLHWHSRVETPPLGWNPYVQLANISQNAQTRLAKATKSSSIKNVRIDRIQRRQQTGVTIFSHWEIVENLNGVRLAHA